MKTMNEIRRSTLDDAEAILTVYKRAAAQGGGLLRREHEVTPACIERNLGYSLSRGVSLVAVHDGRIVGEIHGWAPSLRQLRHVLGDVTIALDPDAQGQGLGRRLFEAFIAAVRTDLSHIAIIELFCREDNARAIALYRSLGFVQQGRLTNRVGLDDGTYIDDLIMALPLAPLPRRGEE